MNMNKDGLRAVFFMSILSRMKHACSLVCKAVGTLSVQSVINMSFCLKIFQKRFAGMKIFRTFAVPIEKATSLGLG